MPDQTLTVARRFVPLLTRWGATPEADLVLRSLAEYGPQGAADLSRSLGLPGRRVRTTLDELAEAGAVRRVQLATGIGLARVRARLAELVGQTRAEHLSSAVQRGNAAQALRSPSTPPPRPPIGPGCPVCL